MSDSKAAFNINTQIGKSEMTSNSCQVFISFNSKLQGKLGNIYSRSFHAKVGL